MSVDIPGWRHAYSGKVRDLYLPTGRHPGGDVVLVVASDRVSAYDHVLSPTIPDKGRVLTALTLWWFERLADVVTHHALTTAVPEVVAGRAMVCRRLRMHPVECVVRGYLSGSAWTAYRESQEVCGVRLPAGLVEGSRLPAPVFTPATKAAIGEHDENVDLAQVAATVGRPAAQALRDTSLEVYRRAARVAEGAGLLLADTKLEFGVLPDADPADPAAVVLGDEVLTPDSSRYWDAASWAPGGAQPSFDKQVVRDWLTSPASGWDRRSDVPPPPLPDAVVELARDRYLEAYRRLTGSPLP